MNRAAAAAALALGLSGCSFVTVQRSRAPLEDPRVPDGCTSSVAAPVADSLGAVAALIGSVYEVADATVGCAAGSPGCGSSAAGTRAAAFLASGLVLGASAIYGFVTTRTCRSYAGLADRCATGDLGACRILSPAWQPPPGWPAAPAVPDRQPGR